MHILKIITIINSEKNMQQLPTIFPKSLYPASETSAFISSMHKDNDDEIREKLNEVKIFLTEGKKCLRDSLGMAEIFFNEIIKTATNPNCASTEALSYEYTALCYMLQLEAAKIDYYDTLFQQGKSQGKCIRPAEIHNLEQQLQKILPVLSFYEDIFKQINKTTTNATRLPREAYRKLLSTKRDCTKFACDRLYIYYWNLHLTKMSLSSKVAFLKKSLEYFQESALCENAEKKAAFYKAYIKSCDSLSEEFFAAQNYAEAIECLKLALYYADLTSTTTEEKNNFIRGILFAYEKANDFSGLQKFIIENGLPHATIDRDTSNINKFEIFGYCFRAAKETQEFFIAQKRAKRLVEIYPHLSLEEKELPWASEIKQSAEEFLQAIQENLVNTQEFITRKRSANPALFSESTPKKSKVSHSEVVDPSTVDPEDQVCLIQGKRLPSFSRTVKHHHHHHHHHHKDKNRNITPPSAGL